MTKVSILSAAASKATTAAGMAEALPGPADGVPPKSCSTRASSARGVRSNARGACSMSVRNSRASVAYGTDWSPGRACTMSDCAARSPTNSASSRLLPMPASPSTTKRAPICVNARSVANASSRPIIRGGRSSVGGIGPLIGVGARTERSTARNSSIVCIDGAAPTSSRNIAAHRSNATMAAAVSPRR